jgi:glycosyltransferase involved in cell wall biosynthesis
MPAPVLFASYAGVMGGAERALLDAAVRLDRPVVVACPAGPLAEGVRAAGLTHAPVRERALALSPAHAAGLAGFAREILGVAREHKPAALVAWGARAILATAPLPRRPPVLAVHHDLLPRAAIRTAVRAATRRAEGAAAASGAIARELAAGPRRAAAASLPDGLAVLHFGVDLAAFAPGPLPSGPPRALVLGALVPWKRPELALEVAERLPELRLTIAGAPLGDGRSETTLRERAATLGDRVTVAGPVDARAALQDAHVLLHCADAEPYGLALVEALACGRPVVAPAAGGPLEIVTGGAGRLYPPGDPGAAAAAVREVLADPGAPAAARRRAEEAFDVEASTRRLEAAIHAVEGRRR